MANIRETEAQLMEMTADDLISEGYRVVIEPSPAELPPELKGFRPDGIALGKKPYLVIEITSAGERSEQLEKIRFAIKDNPDWQLLVVFNGSKTAPLLQKEPLEQIEKLLNTATNVANEDTRAALLMCWAALEALARYIDQPNFRRPQTPGRIIEQLASKAYIVPSEADFLRRLMAKRNEFIHGQLSTSVDLPEISVFVELLTGLVKAHRNTRSRA